MEEDDRDIASLFLEVSRLDRRYSNRHLKGSDFLRGQCRCLFVLDGADRITQRELARLLDIRPPSAGELVRKLEQKGLVSRTASPADARSVELSLTDEGRVFVRKLSDDQARAHLVLVEGLTAAERTAFRNLLTKVRDHYLAIEANPEKTHPDQEDR